MDEDTKRLKEIRDVLKGSNDIRTNIDESLLRAAERGEKFTIEGEIQELFLGDDGFINIIKQRAGESGLVSAVNVIKLLTILLKKYEHCFISNLPKLLVLCDSLYYMNPEGKVKIAGLQLLESTLLCMRHKDNDSVAKYAEKYFFDYARNFNKSTAVVDELGKTLASVCHYLPIRLKEISSRLVREFVMQWNEFRKGSSIEQKRANEIVKNLEQLLSTFSFEFVHEEELYQIVHDMLKNWIQPPWNQDRNLKCRPAMAAISIFRQNPDFFIRFLLTEENFYLSESKNFVGAKECDQQEVGILLMKTVLDVSTKDPENPEYDFQNVRKHIFEQLLNILEDPHAPLQILSIVILEIGNRAPLLYSFLAHENYQNMYLRSLEIIEQYYQKLSYPEKETLNVDFPVLYLSIVKVFTFVSDAANNASLNLRNLFKKLIFDYHLYTERNKELTTDVILELMRIKTLNTFVDEIIQHSNLPDKITSKKSEPESKQSSNQSSVMCTDFWMILFKRGGCEMKSRIMLSFFRTFLGVIERIQYDVGMSARDEAGNNTEESVKSDSLSKPRNVEILNSLANVAIQVMDDCDDLSESLLTHLWKKIPWLMCRYSSVIILHTLVTKLIQVSKIRGIFTEGSTLGQLARSFLQNHLQTLQKLHRVEDATTAFEIMTHLPLDFVLTLISPLSQTLVKLLSEGLRFPKLANIALRTLELYTNKFKEDQIQEILQDVMPMLRPYLLPRTSKNKIRNDPCLHARPKLYEESKCSCVEDNSRLALNVFTKVSIEYKRLSLLTEEEICTRENTWRSGKPIHIHIDLNNGTLELNVSEILPEVIALVNSCSTQKVRRTAISALYEIANYVLCNLTPNTEKPHCLQVQQKILWLILDLSMDQDIDISAPFHQLVTKILESFAKDQRNITVLREVVIGGLFAYIEKGDSSHKQLGTQYLQEILTFSINQLGFMSAILNDVYERIFEMWRHPCKNRRNDGFFVFNVLSRFMEDEEDIGSEYVLKTIKAIFLCFKISSYDTEYRGVSTEMRESLTKARCIFKNLYKKKSKSMDRLRWNEMKFGDQSDFSNWLLDSLKCQLTESQHFALSLLEDIYSCKGESVRSVIQGKYASIINFQRYLEEPPLSIEMAERKEEITSEMYKKYFDTHLLLLDFDICSWTEIQGLPQMINNFMASMIKNCRQMKKYNAAVADVNQYSCNILDTNESHSSDKNNLDGNEKDSIVRLIDLLTAMVNKTCSASFFISEETCCQFFYLTILEPENWNFHLNMVEDGTRFDKMCTRFLKILESKLPKVFEKITSFFYASVRENLFYDWDRILKNIVFGSDLKTQTMLDLYINLYEEEILKLDINEVSLLDDFLRIIPGQESFFNTPENMKIIQAFLELLFSRESSEMTIRVKDLIQSKDKTHQWFVNTFHTYFGNNLLRNIDSIFTKSFFTENRTVMEVLQMFTDHLTLHKNKELTKLFVENVLHHWNLLRGSIYSSLDVLNSVHLVSSLSKIYSFEKKRTDLISWYCDILKSSTIHLRFKSKCLDILTIVLTVDPESRVIESLMELGLKHFPLKSSELLANTAELDTYVNIYLQLLTSFSETGSNDLLFYLISIACREQNHICESKTTLTLVKVLSCSTVEKQVSLLKVPLEIFIDATNSFSNEARLETIQCFVLPAIQKSSSSSIKLIFQEYRKVFVVDMKKTMMEGKCSLDRVLTTQVGVCQMLGVLYSNFGIKDLKNIFQSEEDGAQKDFKSVTANILKNLKEARSITIGVERNSATKKLFKLFHQNRLNCTVLILKSTSTNVDIHYNFIFKECKVSKEFVWEKIVDLENDIYFSPLTTSKILELEAIVKLKHHAKSVLREVFPVTYFDKVDIKVGEYDYTTFISRESRPEFRIVNISDYERTTEKDELESNICLYQLVHWIDVVGKTKPFDHKIYVDESPPAWMLSIMRILKDSDRPSNVKVFALMLVLNGYDTFSPFCKSFFEPILECIVDGTIGQSDECNSLSVDLLFVMLEWTEQTRMQPIKNIALSRTLLLLMKSVLTCNDKDVTILLELITLIFEKWPGRYIVVTCTTFLQDVFDIAPGSERNIGALRLLSVLFFHRKLDKKCLEGFDMIQFIVERFTSPRIQVRIEAANCTGLYLSLLQSLEECVILTRSIVFTALSNMILKGLSVERSISIEILYGIHTHYPNILVNCEVKYQHCLAKLDGFVLKYGLEMLLSFLENSKYSNDLRSQLDLIGLKAFLQSTDTDVQMLALKVLKRCHLYINSREEYYDILLHFRSCQQRDHRKIYFDILIEAASNEISRTRKEVFIKHILAGLIDADEGLQRECFMFLHELFIKTRGFESLKEMFSLMRFDGHEHERLIFFSASLLRYKNSHPTCDDGVNFVQGNHYSHRKEKSECLDNTIIENSFQFADSTAMEIMHPDLKFSAFVSMIMYISNHSRSIAKTLFRSVIQAFFDDLLKSKDHNLLSELFNHIIENSSEYVFECLITVLLDIETIQGLDIMKITKQCQCYGKQYCVIMLVEKYLIEIMKDDRMNGEILTQYCNILRGIEEYEAFYGTLKQFKNELKISRAMEGAMREKENSHWLKASNLYKDLLAKRFQKNTSELEVSAQLSGFYESQKKMATWEELQDTMVNFKEHTDIWSYSFKSIALNAFLTSSMHLITERSNSKTYNLLKNSFFESKKKEFLTETFPLQLAILYSEQKKFKEAKRMIKKAQDCLKQKLFDENSFISRNIDTLLIELQSTCEFKEYLSFEEGECEISNLSNILKKNPSCAGSDVYDYVNILKIRQLIWQKVLSRKVKGASIETISKALSNDIYEFVVTALDNENYILAKRYISKMKKLSQMGTSLSNKRNSAIVRLASLTNGNESLPKMTEKFCAIFKFLYTGVNDKDRLNTLLLEKNVYDCLLSISNVCADLTPSLIQSHFQKPEELDLFKKRIAIKDDKTMSLLIKNKLLDSYAEVYEIEENSYRHGKFLFEGADFLFSIYNGTAETASYDELYVKYHLKSMEAGFQHAREMFLRVLLVMKRDTSARNMFRNAASGISPWMYLPWRNQLIALLFGEMCLYVKSTILSLALAFPQIIACGLESANSSHKNKYLSSDVRHCILEIASKLNLKDCSKKFMKEFHLLILPDVALQILFDIWVKLERYEPSVCKVKLFAEFCKFKERYLLDNNHGKFFKMMKCFYANKLETCLANSNKVELEKMIAELKQKTQEPNHEIRYFSEYFAKFMSIDFDGKIQIPIRNIGFKPPSSDPPPSIFIFEPNVDVYKPKCSTLAFTVLCDNGTRCRIFAKAGRDLVKDESIMNLFRITNRSSLLQKKPQCSRFSIRTYATAPLSKDFGLVEYINGAKSIKDILDEQLLKDDKRYPTERRDKDIQQQSAKRLDSKLSSEYLQLEKTCLRRAIVESKGSPKSMFYARKNFTASYATCSAIHWIVGIGDRHLSNYLVCQNTGFVLGTDFEFSFGVATTLFAVPELVQLRLTPQIVEIMGPNETNGIFRQTVIEVLNRLRRQAEILSYTVKYFLQEDLVDWFIKVARTESIDSEDIEETAIIFKSKAPEMFRRKIMGENPSLITIQQLLMCRRKDYEALEEWKVLIGKNRLSLEAVTSQEQCEGMSVCDQVDRLIDQSRDPELISRMRPSWLPNL